MLLDLLIGPGWFWTFGILAVVAFLGGLFWAIKNYSMSDSVIPGILTFLASFLLIWLSWNAGTHFRVKINQRALLINTISQKIIGVRESGVQEKPLFGAKPFYFHSNTQYKVFIDLQPGTDSAVTANSAPVVIDTTFYLDLSNMDLEAVYLAFGSTNWDQVYNAYILPQFTNISREVSPNYTTKEHETKRDDWEDEYEATAVEFFGREGEGFGIEFVAGRTIMAWTFENDEDAAAYDESNRAGYLVVRRQNEQAAVLIEAETQKIRSGMVVTQAESTVASLEMITTYLGGLSPELRSYTLAYLDYFAQMEYLRQVDQQQPDVFFPPSGGPVTTFPVTPQSENGYVAPEVPAATTEE